MKLALLCLLLPSLAWGADRPTMVYGGPVTTVIHAGRVLVLADSAHAGEVREMLWLLGVLPRPRQPFYREFREEP